MRCLYPRVIRNPSKQYDGLDFSFSQEGEPVLTDTGELIPQTLTVPCGKCVLCLEERRNAWATRMELESRLWRSTSFVTLTYNDQCVPDELKKADLQKFFKRLRKEFTFRYFACGEYGTQGRPHYHAIIWHEVPGEYLFEKLVSDKWSSGFVYIKPGNRDNFRYVAKYTIKLDGTHPEGKQAPFALMSRRPGISGDYMTELQRWNHDYVVLSNGRKDKLPRYNLEKLDPVEQVYIKRFRLQYAESMPELSEIEKYLRETAIKEQLTRKYIHKYGIQEGKSSSGTL